MIKAVIFDCFGVLVGPGFWDVYRAAGGDPDKDYDFIERWQLQQNSGQITPEDFKRIISEKLGITTDQFKAIYNQYQVPHPDLFAFIRDELKPRYQLGLLSNANTGVIDNLIPPHLLQLFDAVDISAETGLLKPQPEAYLHICQRLGVQPDQAVFTDDQERYVAPAAQLGIHAFRFTGFNTFRQDFARAVHVAG